MVVGVAKIADMLKAGKTPQQVADAIKSEATGVGEPTSRTAEQIGQSMVEQDISVTQSLATDLRTDFLMGLITDEQYEDIFEALDG